jgi:hypothetical protein
MTALAQLICTGAAATAALAWTLLSLRLGERPGRDVRGGVLPGSNVTRLLAAEVGLLVLRAAMIAVLAAASPAFVADRIWGFALSAVLSGFAVVTIVLRRRSAAGIAGGAALAAVAELFFTLVVGAPISLWAAGVLVVAVAVGTAAWSIAGLKLGRRPLAATIACGLIAVIAIGIVGWNGSWGLARFAARASRLTAMVRALQGSQPRGTTTQPRPSRRGSTLSRRGLRYICVRTSRPSRSSPIEPSRRGRSARSPAQR